MHAQKAKSSKAKKVVSKPKKEVKNTGNQSSEKEKTKTEPATPTGVKCSLKEMDGVLLQDSTNKIKESGKWPLLIDESGRATTFLKYRDSNYLCTANSNDMQSETLRRALIGSIRFGKPFVIDMLDADMFEFLEKAFNEILPNLMQDLMNKDITKDDKFMKLVQPEDGSSYDVGEFSDSRLESFMFIVATTKETPPQSLLSRMVPVRVELG